MHVFHIRGFSGLLMMLLAVLSVLVLALLLPAAFMMVLWNATVFEAFKSGPEISLYQGGLLWGVALILIKLIFKPEIQFQFQQMPMQKTSAPTDAQPVKTEQGEELKAAADESQPPTLDKQN